MIKLAVIGAGIGGCSAAYFAHKFLPYSKVTVYEMNKRIGGRVYTFKDEEIKKELGAEFFNSANKTVCNLVKEIDLETKKLEEFRNVAVWNGTEIIFQSNHQMFYKMLELFSKYKLSVPKLLLSLTETNMKIKKLHEKYKPREFWELFENVGLDRWYKLPFDKILMEMGIERRFIDELITPITRIIYSQDAKLGGFAGLSSLLGIYGKAIYRIEDGNNVLPRKLLEASESEVKMESKVESIEKTSKNTFRVSIGESSSVFDGVIVATPLESADIKLEGIENKWQPIDYQKIYIKLMKGTIDKRYFNLDPHSRLPSIILTSKEADPITRFSINKSTNNESLVTVTSTEPLCNDLLDDIFKNGRTILDHTWNAAYPIFKPIEKIPATILDKGLLYLNAIESAASSLESSTFAALNSINIIKTQINA